MPCGFISPNLNARSKKINKDKEIAILIVSAFTVLLEFLVSFTKKNKPLPKETTIRIMINIMKILVNICYTPETSVIS
jgi:hypothetical protein